MADNTKCAGCKVDLLLHEVNLCDDCWYGEPSLDELDEPVEDPEFAASEIDYEKQRDDRAAGN